MEDRGLGDQFHFLGRQTQGLGQAGRVGAHSGHVPGSVGVLGLDCLRQSLDDLEVGALHLGIQAEVPDGDGGIRRQEGQEILVLGFVA